MSEDFDREGDLQFFAHYWFEPEYTDDELRDMGVLLQNAGSCVSSIMHVLWYSCERALKTEEMKLLNFFS